MVVALLCVCDGWWSTGGGVSGLKESSKSFPKLAFQGFARLPPPSSDWPFETIQVQYGTSPSSTVSELPKLQTSLRFLPFASLATVYIHLPSHSLMRTSRISRDTAKVIAASRAQRPLRQTRSGANATIRDFTLNTLEAAHVALRPRESESAHHDSLQQHSDSDLSSVPEDVALEDGDAPVSKKRKRGKDTPTKTTVKQEVENVDIANIASPVKGKKKPTKPRRVPAKKSVDGAGNVKVEPPPNWEEIYALTRQMRNENVAPVDTMGCESLADRKATPRDQRFQTLVSLMLSSQTKDTVTSVAIKGMQDNMPGVSSYSFLLDAGSTLTETGL